jgi:hypothetical protein
MARSSVRIRLDHGGMRALLRSSAMVDELRDRAARIAAAAGEGFGSEAFAGRNRAIGAAFPLDIKAWQREQSNRVLTRAIDAAR